MKQNMGLIRQIKYTVGQISMLEMGKYSANNPEFWSH